MEESSDGESKGGDSVSDGGGGSGECVWVGVTAQFSEGEWRKGMG